MRRAAFLVMPSESYETFGMVSVEAFANGLPVIASRLGAMAEIITDGKNGLLFRPGDAADLADKVRFVASRPDVLRTLSEGARSTYEAQYTPEVNLRALMAIYEGVVAERHGRNPAHDPVATARTRLAAS